MEHAMVSVATGVMSSLLGKLSTVLDKEYSMLKSVRDEIIFLKDELSCMNALLVKLADVDDLDVQVKEWRNQVQDLAYDIEDCIDDFMHRVGHNPEIKKGFLQKSIHRLKTLRARHDIAQQIWKLKDRVDHVSKRRERYNFVGAISSSTDVVTIDPRLPALYAESAGMVGMDGPIDEIIKLLTEGEEESVQKLRVVSIVGFGGLGKTTLANQVFRELKDQFECQAFVSVSQKPDMISLLSKIQCQVKGPKSVPACEVQDQIDALRKYLKHKRYFIVIDDLWKASAWDVVRSAFPENNNSSRIITTTRIATVAKECCGNQHKYIYNMKSLSDQDSRRLFFNRIFGSEDACPLQLKKVSVEILKKCGGLPLAVVTIASLLASQTTKVNKQWELVRNSLDSMFGTNPTLDGMRQILNLSYKNLPHYLKTCFLYLGIYPEDYIIQKDDLVKQWVAEGFVIKVHGQDVEDVAESYFNELVNRSMIQLVYTDYEDMQLSCKVHDMMLDLIICISREYNFITTIDHPQDIIGLCDKVRRLSLHPDYTKQTVPVTINLSQVRSLAIFRAVEYIYMLPLSEFKHLRVLFVDFWHMPWWWYPIFDLTALCMLSQLRYFKIRLHCSSQLRLPSDMRGLQHLETFDINVGLLNQNFVIAADIVHLPHLSHLIFPRWTRLPDGIGKMESLHSLEGFDLDMNSYENIKGLGELTNLRYLDIRFTGAQSYVDATKYVDVLCSSLGKIVDCNIQCLSLCSSEGTFCCDGLSCLSPSQCLQRLCLSKWWFSRVPKWIWELHNLEFLRLEVRELLNEDVRILGQLPALTDLKLLMRGDSIERIVICGMAFPVLKHFAFMCEAAPLPILAFESGAMPILQRLELSFHAHGAEQYGPQLSGIEHLSGLKQIYSRIACIDAEVPEIIAVESALRNAIDVHPSRPRHKLLCVPSLGNCFVDDKEGDEHRTQDYCLRRAPVLRLSTSGKFYACQGSNKSGQ